MNWKRAVIVFSLAFVALLTPAIVFKVACCLCLQAGLYVQAYMAMTVSLLARICAHVLICFEPRLWSGSAEAIHNCSQVHENKPKQP